MSDYVTSASGVFRCVLGFPPGQRRDGGVGVAVRIVVVGVGSQGRFLLLLLLAVRVVHRQRDERGRLPVGGRDREDRGACSGFCDLR